MPKANPPPSKPLNSGQGPVDLVLEAKKKEEAEKAFKQESGKFYQDFFDKLLDKEKHLIDASFGDFDAKSMNPQNPHRQIDPQEEKKYQERVLKCIKFLPSVNWKLKNIMMLEFKIQTISQITDAQVESYYQQLLEFKKDSNKNISDNAKARLDTIQSFVHQRIQYRDYNKRVIIALFNTYSLFSTEITQSGDHSIKMPYSKQDLEKYLAFIKKELEKAIAYFRVENYRALERQIKLIYSRIRDLDLEFYNSLLRRTYRDNIHLYEFYTMNGYAHKNILISLYKSKKIQKFEEVTNKPKYAENFDNFIKNLLNIVDTKTDRALAKAELVTAIQELGAKNLDPVELESFMENLLDYKANPNPIKKVHKEIEDKGEYGFYAFLRTLREEEKKDDIAIRAFVKYTQNTQELMEKDKRVRDQVSSITLQKIQPWFETRKQYYPALEKSLEMIFQEVTNHPKMKLPDRVQSSKPMSMGEFRNQYPDIEVKSDPNLLSNVGESVETLKQDQVTMNVIPTLDGASFLHHQKLNGNIEISARKLPLIITNPWQGQDFPSEKLLQYAEDQISVMLASSSENINILPDPKRPQLVRAYLLVCKAKDIPNVVNQSGIPDPSPEEVKHMQDDLHIKPSQELSIARNELIADLRRENYSTEADEVKTILEQNPPDSAQKIADIIDRIRRSKQQNHP